MIRLANSDDKARVLTFCKNTFSWGDYVEQVWDHWLSEGNLFLYEKQFPVGICHALFFKKHLWIEGIRIDPSFKRQKIASGLVKHIEMTGRKKNISTSYMLIDVKNTPSLRMAKFLDYGIYQSWNFYSLSPCKKNSYGHIKFENHLDANLCVNYVDSWRWFPIDDKSLYELYTKNRIISCQMDEKKSFAIITDSKHFEKTMIVTLYSTFSDATREIISFLQNFAYRNNYKRIQILTKEDLSNIRSTEFKISFNLMRKFLS